MESGKIEAIEDILDEIGIPESERDELRDAIIDLIYNETEDQCEECPFETADDDQEIIP